MCTCDICGTDVLDPNNLIRVWIENRSSLQAILVCDDCLERDSDTGEYLTVAEDDPRWSYLATKQLS